MNNSIVYRVYNNNRRDFLRDAISYELRCRLLRRDCVPKPPLDYLSNSMEHARKWDKRANSHLGAKQ